MLGSSCHTLRRDKTIDELIVTGRVAQSRAVGDSRGGERAGSRPRRALALAAGAGLAEDLAQSRRPAGAAAVAHELSMPEGPQASTALWQSEGAPGKARGKK